MKLPQIDRRSWSIIGPHHSRSPPNEGAQRPDFQKGNKRSNISSQGAR